jgi:hypothetical protein
MPEVTQWTNDEDIAGFGTGTRCYFANGSNILGLSGIRDTEI